MSKVWFTSDWHLFHKNIIRYCERPYGSIQAMNHAIVTNINNSIAKNDELFVLGDVSFFETKAIEILKKMKGRKHLIVGNHDKKKIIQWDGWESVSEYKEINRNGHNIILCHYPLESWKNMARGYIHLHGHRHGSVPDNHRYLRADIGVDCWNYMPVSFEMLLKKWMAEGRIV